jgi:hypothetical protein
VPAWFEFRKPDIGDRSEGWGDERADSMRSVLRPYRPTAWELGSLGNLPPYELTTQHQRYVSCVRILMTLLLWLISRASSGGKVGHGASIGAYMLLFSLGPRIRPGRSPG